MAFKVGDSVVLLKPVVRQDGLEFLRGQPLEVIGGPYRFDDLALSYDLKGRDGEEVWLVSGEKLKRDTLLDAYQPILPFFGGIECAGGK